MPYITPENTPATFDYWRVLLPRDERMLAAILGQLTELIFTYNWEQTDGISVLETNTLASDIYESFQKGNAPMIGCLINYVTDTPPQYVLPCDGSIYNRVDYPELYAALPASLIIDPDTFQTPDIQDKFVLSAGTNYPVEDTGGETEHTLVENELPAHTHGYQIPTTNVDVESVGIPDPTGVGLPLLPATTDPTGADEPHNNMPPYVAYKIGIIAK